MKQIPLSRGMVALVDDEDWITISAHKWHACKTHRTGTYYAARRDSQRRHVYMHRVIVDAAPGQKVDHADGNGLSNVRSNLRFATQSQNGANQVRLLPTNTSGYRGVSWFAKGKCWQVSIRQNGKRKFIGHFADLIEAAKAYDRAAIAAHGAFARPNFPTANEDAA